MFTEIKTIFIVEYIYMIIFFFITCLDFVTGVSNALLKKEFSSNKLRSGISKYIIYFAFVILGCFIEFIYNLSGVAHSIVLIMCAIEIISIIENFEKITGLKVFERLKNFMNKIINKE